jgi:hypothetical protein
MTDLDELIAAERENPPTAEPDEVKATWKRISASAATGVPLPVDLSPAAVKVTASSKLAALVASTSAKVTIAVTLVGGSTVAVVASQPKEPTAPVSAATSNASGPDEGGPDGERERTPRARASTPAIDTSVPAPTPRAEPVPEEPDAEIALPTSPDLTEETSATVAGTKVRRRPRPQPTTQQEQQDIAAELALIQAAQRSLRADDPQSALQNLRTHRQRHPDGTMKEDRLALEVIALCAAGRHDEGTRARTEFLRSWPQSIYIDRVRQACDHDAPDHD